MAKNYIQPGEIIDHAPSSAVSSGDPAKIGDRVGVAQIDVAADEEGAFAVDGVYALPKASGAISQGAAVYLTSAGKVGTTETGNTAAGYAFVAAASGDATILVKINA